MFCWGGPRKTYRMSAQKNAHSELQIPHYNSIFCHKTPLYNSIFYHETPLYNSIF